MAKSFFIDTSRCTACRGCQVACKQWKKQPAETTENWGSYQNPRDLSPSTFKLVRFSEEALIAADPDVYLIQKGPMNPAPTPLAERDHYKGLRAVREGRVLVVDDERLLAALAEADGISRNQCSASAFAINDGCPTSNIATFEFTVRLRQTCDPWAESRRLTRLQAQSASGNGIGYSRRAKSR